MLLAICAWGFFIQIMIWIRVFFLFFYLYHYSFCRQSGIKHSSLQKLKLHAFYVLLLLSLAQIQKSDISACCCGLWTGWGCFWYQRRPADLASIWTQQTEWWYLMHRGIRRMTSSRYSEFIGLVSRNQSLSIGFLLRWMTTDCGKS